MFNESKLQKHFEAMTQGIIKEMASEGHDVYGQSFRRLCHELADQVRKEITPKGRDMIKGDVVEWLKGLPTGFDSAQYLLDRNQAYIWCKACTGKECGDAFDRLTNLIAFTIYEEDEFYRLLHMSDGIRKEGENA